MGPAALLFPEMTKKIYSSQDWKVEYESCKQWDRPARQNLTDTPYYPWMPPPKQPFSVTFKLGFK